jgi:glycosyltransferase involved in cell wall biosynthesis
LRRSLKHMVWGRIMRYNLKHCDKVLVSTPDILAQARAFRTDADYLPNPVDTELFYPKPLIVHDGKMRVLIASSASIAKGTDIAIRALSELKDKVEVSIIYYGADYAEMLALAKSLNLQINSLPKLTHESIREYFWNVDLVLDQFKCGVVGNVFWEAIACGRPALGYVSSKYPEFEKLPLKDIDSSEKIVKAIEGIRDLTDLWKAQYAYLKAEHDVNMIAKKISRLYRELQE